MKMNAQNDAEGVAPRNDPAPQGEATGKQEENEKEVYRAEMETAYDRALDDYLYHTNRFQMEDDGSISVILNDGGPKRTLISSAEAEAIRRAQVDEAVRLGEEPNWNDLFGDILESAMDKKGWVTDE